MLMGCGRCATNDQLIEDEMVSLRDLHRLLLMKVLGFVPSSSDYWEHRYRRGGNSGSGSYGQLAQYKARVLNDLVARERIQSVSEFGVGDGAQLALAVYPSYVGYDVAPSAVAKCRKRFCGDPTKQFALLTEDTVAAPAELTLSLDVVYHLVEDEVFDSHMRQLIAATRFAIIYSSNHSGTEDSRRHIRHRSVTDWMMRHAPNFCLAEHAPNPFPWDLSDKKNTSFAEFFVYRHLA